jgi:hypothetical protein
MTVQFTQVVGLQVSIIWNCSFNCFTSCSNLNLPEGYRTTTHFLRGPFFILRRLWLPPASPRHSTRRLPRHGKARGRLGTESSKKRYRRLSPKAACKRDCYELCNAYAYHETSN